MKKLYNINNKEINANFDEIFGNLRITDILFQGEDDYFWTSAPTATDKQKPFIRPVKVANVRYIYFFDTASEVWAYLTLTNA